MAENSSSSQGVGHSGVDPLLRCPLLIMLMNHPLLEPLVRPSVRVDTDLGSGKGIGRITVPRVEVDGNGVRNCGEHKSQRHHHADLGAVHISHRASQGRDDGAAKDTTNDQSGTALRVATQSAHAQGDDGGEADGLEEEDDEEHGNGSVSSHKDGRDQEDADRGQVGAKDKARLEEVHKENTGKAPHGKRGLSTCEELGANGRVGPGTSLDSIVDEKRGDGDLGASVAELGKGGVEKTVLLPKRLISFTCVGLLGLASHICVGDLGDVTEEEDDGKREDKAGDG